MFLINLKSIPNQTLETVLEKNIYTITLKKCDDVMCVTIIKNGIILVQNLITVAEQFLIPFDYLSVDGNFAFISPESDLPDYKKFGITQNLYFFTASEISGFKNG